MREYLAVYDTETTGLDAVVDDICQFAVVVHKNGDPLDETLQFETLCKPRYSISEASREIHHISNDMVADKPSAQQVIQEWWGEMKELAAGGDIVLAGHNTEFDMRFLKNHLPSKELEGIVSICTMRLARRIAPKATNHKLEHIYREHLKFSSPKTQKAHDALCDVWMCYEVLQHYKESHHQNQSYRQMALQLAKPLFLETMPFGKHKGELMNNLPRHYLRWIVAQTNNIDQDVWYTANCLI